MNIINGSCWIFILIFDLSSEIKLNNEPIIACLCTSYIINKGVSHLGYLAIFDKTERIVVFEQ